MYSYSELDTDALLRALEYRFHTALAVPVTLDGAVVAIFVLFASQPLTVSATVGVVCPETPAFSLLFAVTPFAVLCSIVLHWDVCVNVVVSLFLLWCSVLPKFPLSLHMLRGVASWLRHSPSTHLHPTLPQVSESVIGFVHSTACSVGSLMEWHKSLVCAPAGQASGEVPPPAEYTNILPRFPAAKPPAVTPTMLCADSVLLTIGMALGACRCESWFPFMEASGTPCFRITALVLPQAESGAITSADGDPASQHLCTSIQSRPSQMWWDATALASLNSTAQSATSFPILQKGADDSDTLAAVVVVYWSKPLSQHMSVTNFLVHAAHAVGLATPLVASLPPPPQPRAPQTATGAGPGVNQWAAAHSAAMMSSRSTTFAPTTASHAPPPPAPAAAATSSASSRGNSSSAHRKRVRDDSDATAGLSAASAKRREEYDKMGGTRKLSAAEQDLVRRDVRDTRTVLDIDARRGKWTPEEEAYCAELVAGFQAGILPIGEGTTLRSMLSQQLHCVPMRITKKYNKDSSMGKQMYRRSNTMAPLTWCQARDNCLAKLARLRGLFVHKVQEKSDLDLDQIVEDAIGSESFFNKGITVQQMQQLMASSGMPVPAAALPSSAVAGLVDGDASLQ